MGTTITRNGKADIAAGASDSRIPIPLMLCRNADGTVLDATGAATDFKIVPGGWGDGAITLAGSTAAPETTITSTLAFEFALPPEYVAGTDVEVNIQAKYFVDGVPPTTKTIDVEAYELTDAGAAGADLVDVGDAAEAMTDTYGDTTGFTIDGSGLVAGDKLSGFVRTVITTPAGSAGEAHIGSIEAQIARKAA